MTATRVCWRSLRASAECARSASRARLGRPVNGSWVASWASRSSNARPSSNRRAFAIAALAWVASRASPSPCAGGSGPACRPRSTASAMPPLATGAATSTSPGSSRRPASAASSGRQGGVADHPAAPPPRARTMLRSLARTSTRRSRSRDRSVPRHEGHRAEAELLGRAGDLLDDGGQVEAGHPPRGDGHPAQLLGQQLRLRGDADLPGQPAGQPGDRAGDQAQDAEPVGHRVGGDLVVRIGLCGNDFTGDVGARRGCRRSPAPAAASRGWPPPAPG